MLQVMNSVYLSLFLVQSIVMIVLSGVLISKLFDRDAKNRPCVVWFLGLVVLWIIFLSVGAWSVLAGELNEIFGMIAFASFVIMLVLFGALIIKRFEFFNKPLLFSEAVLLLVMLIMILVNFRHYPQNLVLVIAMMAFVSTFLGYFIVISFLINISGKFKLKKMDWFLSWKVIVIVVGAVLLLSFFSFTGYVTLGQDERSGELSGELNIYNWEDYFDEDDAVLDDFEKEFGVKVNLHTYETEIESLDAVENYEGVYDVVVGIDINFKEEIANDKLEKLNLRNIPNVKNVDSRFEILYNENFEYGVPYLWGTTGLVINTKYVPEDVDSWNILWDPEYRGKVGILFNEVELFSLGARYVGAPLISSKISDLIRINDFLKLQKELVGGYMKPYDIIDGMIDESLWVAATWNVDAAIISYNNPNIKYIIPKEGTFMWTEHMVIPKGAPNKINAEAFINFIHRPDIYVRIANYQGSPGVNIPAREFIDEEIMSDESLNIPKEDYDKLEDHYSFVPSEDILKVRHEIWEELIA